MRLFPKKKTAFFASLFWMLWFALLCAPGGAEKETVLLARRDEWAVYRGAPELEGRSVTVTSAQWTRGPLMLVSPAYPLPADYPPPETRTVGAMVGAYLSAEESVALNADMVYALCRLQAAWDFTGQITVCRGREAESSVPGAYESEHQTGYAADILLSSPAGKWLEENLWRFGLIQRYAPGQEDEGGCEGIHLRYVGLPHAAAMRTLNLNLEDYLSLLRREEKITLFRDDQPYAYLFCAPEREGITFSLPEGAAYEISGDNDGFVVVAVAAGNGF